MKLFKNSRLKRHSMLANKVPSILHSVAYLCLAMCTINVASADQGYLPDAQKLATKASRSKDLYVEPDFDFKTFNTYTLELSVTDQDQQPAPSVILRVFSTDDENIQSEDGVPAQKSLLGIVRTDQYGSVYQPIEISQSVKQVLLELNSQSPDNQVLIKLTDQEYISHSFTVD